MLTVVTTCSISKSQAWNELGAAAELAGRASQAVSAYCRSLAILDEQGARFNVGHEDEAESSLWEEAVRIAKGNAGRALVTAGRAEEALANLRATDLDEV